MKCRAERWFSPTASVSHINTLYIYIFQGGEIAYSLCLITDTEGEGDFWQIMIKISENFIY